VKRRKRERQALYKLKNCKRVNGRRVSVVDNFDFTTVKKWAPKKNRAMAAMRDEIALQLPEKLGDGMMDKTGMVTYSFRVNPEVVRIFGYVQDETTEEIERHENATFTMYLNETSQNLQGNVRLYDRLFNYRTDDGALTVTELPLEEGLCDIPSSLAKKTAGHPSSPRHLHAGGDHDHGQQLGSDGALEARHQHRQLRHKHHLEHVARVLATGKSPRPFLIFINFDVSEGPHPQWGDVTALVKCPKSFMTPERIQSIIEEVREDYAPFDVEVTADRAVYDAWGSNRVKANVVDKVVLSGKLMSCGVAFMNTYSQVDNNVWASCDCGGPGATAGTISHEVGHTFGLRHDGDTTRPEGKTTREYLFSLPKYDKEPSWPKSRRWNTIMGGSIETGVRQWNPGSYEDASNTIQDDVDMLRNTIGNRPGMKCNQVSKSGVLCILVVRSFVRQYLSKLLPTLNYYLLRESANRGVMNGG
jgi:hypothetical protein